MVPILSQPMWQIYRHKKMSVAIKQIKIFREKVLNITLVQQIFIKCLVIPGIMVFAGSAKIKNKKTQFLPSS